MKLNETRQWLLAPPQACLDTHSRPSSAPLSKELSSQKGLKSPTIISLIQNCLKAVPGVGGLGEAGGAGGYKPHS